MSWSLIVLGLFILYPFALEWRRKPLDARMRADADGAFAQLRSGETHYAWIGPETGKVAVCVHGLTTPSFVWRGLAAGLARAGYRVLIYDLYGRGYSERVKGKQTSDFFITQLDELLQDQGVTNPFMLIGYSMGGAIVSAFAWRFPELVRRLVLIAPAGMGHELGPAAEFIRRTPLGGDWMFLLMYPGQLRKGIEAERDLPGSVPNITDLQLAELGKRGFVPAVLASLRGLLNTSLEGAHREMAAEQLPVLALWGADDDVIPLSAKERFEGWNPKARNVVFDGAGHGLTYTHTDQILSEILRD